MSDSAGGSDPIQKLEEAAERETRTVATRGQVQGVERRSSRRAQIVTLLSMLIAILSVSLSGWNSFEISRNEGKTAARQALTTEALDSLKAANQKLADQGLPEIPLPRPGQPIDADAIAAAAAALMYDRIRNDLAFKGPEGDAGTPGQPGLPGESCTPDKPGCVGPGGPEGPSGADGADGLDGKTPTEEDVLSVVSFYCSQPTQPCSGDQGPVGPEGPAGPVGPEGPQGPPPAVFTFTIPGDGLLVPDRNYTCSPSPAGSTNFVCN